MNAYGLQHICRTGARGRGLLLPPPQPAGKSEQKGGGASGTETND
nr:MAG TPA_asm: hypothetical protein [Caudoviricetes sp.]